MWDITCVLATLIFFLAAAVYTSACEKLSGKVSE